MQDHVCHVLKWHKANILPCPAQPYPGLPCNPFLLDMCKTVSDLECMLEVLCTHVVPSIKHDWASSDSLSLPLPLVWDRGWIMVNGHTSVVAAMATMLFHNTFILYVVVMHGASQQKDLAEGMSAASPNAIPTASQGHPKGNRERHIYLSAKLGLYLQPAWNGLHKCLMKALTTFVLIALFQLVQSAKQQALILRV